MNIPNKLKIGGLIYDIIFYNETIMDNYYGKHTSGKQLIQLSEGMTEGYATITFLHEVIHAINKEIDEETVVTLSNGLYQVIKDNQLQF